MTYLMIAIVAFAVSSFGPGFFFLRRVKMSPGERVTASVGLSLLLIYLSSFLVFLFRLPTAVHGSILLICAALNLLAGRDLIRFLKEPGVRQLLVGFGFLAVWSLVLVSLIRNYSGDNWYGDWLEHYQRSLFHLGQGDLDIVLHGDYAIPARPPLMNVLRAYFMTIGGGNWAVYLILSTLLSILIYFSACL